MTTAAQLAAALIASLEGLRLTAYQDSGGVWTIGFGHTAGVKMGDICTVEQATVWLEADAAPLFALATGMSISAQAGYVSFGYNCGKAALELILSGVGNMSRWVHDAHGNVLDGLVHRRALEAALIGLG